MRRLNDDQMMQSVAIIGMAGRFPGANDIRTFWNNLMNGTDSLEIIPDDELRRQGLTEDIINHPQCIKRAGVLNGIDLFDAAFFGYSPREAELIDPQQRFFLECCWEALEDSGYVPETIRGLTGVFAGAGMNNYFIRNILSQSGQFEDIVDFLTFIGNDKDYLCSRVSYKFGFQGPSFVVQSACSTSLVAVQLGYQSIITGQCDLALCGGVSFQTPRSRAGIYREGEIFSADGLCKTFDEKASGIVFGEGLGIVVLKRLEDALADRDHIYSIIRTVVVNNDGSAKAGYTAPGVDAQSKLIALAHSLAGVSADEIDFVEAHGTGTKLGDAIEVAALTQAFLKSSRRRRYCALGSVKTNVGHLDAAAGVTGLIKAALSLENRTLPASLNCKVENPELHLDTSPFYIATNATSWPASTEPLIAGVSSFGMGGTNAHAILQEPPVRQPTRSMRKYHCFPISARTDKSIDSACANLAGFLHGREDIAADDLAFTLQRGRRAFSNRWCTVCRDPKELRSTLLSAKDGGFRRGIAPVGRVPVVFAFSGQGTQYPGMAAGLYSSEDLVRTCFDEARDIFLDETKEDLFDILFPPVSRLPEQAALQIKQTEYTQPVLFSVEYAIARLFMSYGITPDALIGHSIGEYTAAAIAGVFSFEKGLRLVSRRGKLMASMPTGAMAFVGLSKGELRDRLSENLVVALCNGPAASVVSGPVEEVDAFEKRLQKEKIRSSRLQTSHAFHSPMMKEAARLFEIEIATFRLAEPKIPIISNVTGDWLAAEQATTGAYWAQHLRNTVRFSEGITTLFKNGYKVFLEVGPGNTIASFINMHPTAGGPVTTAGSLRHIHQQGDDEQLFLAAIADLWVAGVPVDWQLFYRDGTPHRIPLPTYPFDRKRYWIDYTRSRGDAPLSIATRAAASADSDTENVTSSSAATVPVDVTSRDDLLKLVAGAWDNVLRIGTCGADESFIALGGNSLMLSQIVARLNAQLPFVLPLSFLLGCYTINGQVDRVLEFARSAVPLRIDDVTKSVNTEPVLSPAQKRLWYICQLDKDSAAFNLTHTFRIRGTVNVELVSQALQQIVKRHVSLRCTFTQNDGVPSVHVLDDVSISLSAVDCIRGTVDEGARQAAELIRKVAARPFDLEHGPLFRCGLYTLSPDEHLLVLFVHHITSDGWSMTILHKELSECYQAFIEQREPKLNDLEKSYFDYASYMNRQEKSESPQDTEFWKHYFRGGLPVLSLPTDYPRPKTLKYTGGLLTFSLPADLARKITAFAADRQVTPFSILLSIYGLLLYRYSRQEQIIVGFPSANRERVEFEPLVGLFLNMLPLKLHFMSEITVEQLIESTYNDSVEVLSHQGLQFGRLVELLQPERHLNISPVFQTMFAYNNYSFGSDGAAAVKFQPTVSNRGATEYDLSLYMWSTADTMCGAFEYSDELFQQSTITQLSCHFQSLLGAALDNPSSVTAKLPLFNSEELADLAARKFYTTCEVPENETIHSLIDRALLANGKGVAITDGKRAFGNAELSALSNQICNTLRGADVAAGMLVGVHMSRSIDILPVLLGILKAGAAYVPLDPLFPPDRIDYMIQGAQLRFIIADATNSRRFDNVKSVKILTFGDGNAEFKGQSTECGEFHGNSDNLAYILYTSGSTGAPKGVEIQHRAVVNFLLSMKKSPGIDRADNLLAVTTISFDIAGLELFLPLIAGATITLVDSATASDGFELKKRLESSGATIMQATPATWRMLLEAGWKNGTGLKILCGGEALSRELADKLLATGAELWNMYGPTETTIWSSVGRIKPGNREPDLGKPIDNTQFFFLDENLQEVPRGVIAELCIGGMGLAAGYHRKPDLTEERFGNIDCGGKSVRVYRTGDLVRANADGIIEFLGRADRQVKIRGYRIELEEIEVVLNRQASVAQSVISTYQTSTGNELVAYIRPASGAPVNAGMIREYLGNHLPHYMVPPTIIEINEFPLTPNGKIDRKKLPAPRQEAIVRQSSKGRPARDTVDEQLIGIWEQILVKKNITIDDDYFEMGGNSLSATRLFALIRRTFGVELPLAMLYNAATVAGLADTIRSFKIVPSWKSLVPIQPKGEKPPLFLVHGAGGNVLLYRSLSKNLGASYPVYGLQARGLNDTSELRTSVEEMAATYIEEIRNLQPSGPYFLGGYCMGGLIAYEIARRLRMAGEDVGLVALISTSAKWVELSLVGKLRYRFDNILFHLKNINDADMPGKYRFITERTGEALRRINRNTAVFASTLFYKLKLRKARPIVTMEKVNDAAAFRYVPPPYDGMVTLFKPKGAQKYAVNSAWGWDAVQTGKVVIIDLHGFLNGVLVEPYVKELADRIRRVLDKETV